MFTLDLCYPLCIFFDSLRVLIPGIKNNLFIIPAYALLQRTLILLAAIHLIFIQYNGRFFSRGVIDKHRVGSRLSLKHDWDVRALVYYPAVHWGTDRD